MAHYTGRDVVVTIGTRGEYEMTVQQKTRGWTDSRLRAFARARGIRVTSKTAVVRCMGRVLHVEAPAEGGRAENINLVPLEGGGQLRGMGYGPISDILAARFADNG